MTVSLARTEFPRLTNTEAELQIVAEATKTGSPAFMIRQSFTECVFEEWTGSIGISRILSRVGSSDRLRKSAGSAKRGLSRSGPFLRRAIKTFLSRGSQVLFMG